MASGRSMLFQFHRQPRLLLSLNLLLQLIAILIAETDAVGPAATSNGVALATEDHPRDDDADEDDGIGREISVEYCQLETFNASCVGVASRQGRQNVILITSARYGRMKVGRCVPVDYFTGCSVDALPLIEKRCSGRRECAVVVSNRQLFRVHPCRKDLVAYLEVTYRCIEVYGLDDSEDRSSGSVSPPPPTGSRALGQPTPASSSASASSSAVDDSHDSCEHLTKTDGAGAPGPHLLTRSSGYLAASSVSATRATATPAGDSERSTAHHFQPCPWVIRARPGQQIALAVYDFGSGDQVAGAQSTNVDDDPSGRNPYRDQQFDDDWPTGGLPSSSSSSAGAASDPIDPCPLIAVFDEPPSAMTGGDQLQRNTRRGGSLRLCDVDQGRGAGSSSSSTPVYKSSGNQLAIRFVAHGNDSAAMTSLMNEHRLFLYYEVTGCPDVAPPPDAWLVRTGNGESMVVSCNFTLKKWHIVCNGRKWVGSFTNCSNGQQQMPVVVSSTTEKELKSTKKFSYGLLVAVAIGVVIGIVVGFTFLLLVCVCKRRRLRRERKYTVARGAGTIGADTDNDDFYNKSLIAAQMASTATSTTCDYTVLPQDSMMTSSFTGRRILSGDGGVRSPNRAMYVPSLDWRPENMPMDGIGRPEIEVDDMGRFTWACDCRLVPVTPPPPPMSSTLPVSGLPAYPETDEQHWRNMTLDGGGFRDHRRCTCTSGRCQQTTMDCLLPAEVASYHDSRRHAHESSEEDFGDGDVINGQRSRIRTVTSSPGECNQY